MNQKDIIRFIFELGQLRQEARHGWLRIYENPESVAEHTQRAACLGYLLAHCEGFPDPNAIATMILFHDMHEVRTGDADLVQKRYVNLQPEDELRAATEQVIGLADAGEKILDMWKEIDAHRTAAGQIAKDAEILEMAFTARELVVRGNTDAQEWIDASTRRLETQSARQLLKLVNESDPCTWWKQIWGIM
jgi:putative hydrolase of HD superfamily